MEFPSAHREWNYISAPFPGWYRGRHRRGVILETVTKRRRDQRLTYFRFRHFLLPAIALSAAALILNGCAANKTAFSFYDECSVQNSSFIAMAECGKQKRMAYCTEHNNCSSSGTAFVQYTDSLVLSVKNKEMTEAEALRRFAEYKTTSFANARRDAAIVAAGAAAASGPTTCTQVGNTITCN